MSEYRFLYWDDELPRELYSDFNKAENATNNSDNTKEVLPYGNGTTKVSPTFEYINSKSNFNISWNSLLGLSL